MSTAKWLIFFGCRKRRDAHAYFVEKVKAKKKYKSIVKFAVFIFSGDILLKIQVKLREEPNPHRVKPGSFILDNQQFLPDLVSEKLDSLCWYSIYRESSLNVDPQQQRTSQLISELLT